MSQTATLQGETDQVLTRTIEALRDLNAAYRGTRGFMQVFGDDESLREDLREIDRESGILISRAHDCILGLAKMDPVARQSRVNLLDETLDMAEEAFNLVK